MLSRSWSFGSRQTTRRCGPGSRAGRSSLLSLLFLHSCETFSSLCSSKLFRSGERFSFSGLLSLPLGLRLLVRSLAFFEIPCVFFSEESLDQRAKSFALTGMFIPPSTSDLYATIQSKRSSERQVQRQFRLTSH